MYASMKWRHLSRSQLYARAVARLRGMAQEEVYRGDEMANPPGTKAFTVDRHRFVENLCIFVLFVLCNRRRSYLFRVVSSSVVRLWCRQREGPCVSGVRWSKRSAQVRRERSCRFCSHYQMKKSRVLRNGQNG